MTLTVDAEDAVTQLVVDLIGDGVAAPVTLNAEDARPVTAIRFLPAKAGAFELQVRATDVCGQTDATGARRAITVTP